MKNFLRSFQVAIVGLVFSSFLYLRAGSMHGVAANLAASGWLPPPDSAGWYTPEQAANGAKSYQKQCADCHGTKLQGSAAAPALVGKQFWLAYGGKKVSTLWSAIHTKMPINAPGSVSAKNSTNIMAFLLQKNGVASGSVPLDDTTDLSKVLPSK